MSISSILRDIFTNALVLLTGNIGANLFGLLSIALLTRSLGAEIFGYYVLFITFIEIIDRIFNLQSWQAFIKFATDVQAKNNKDQVLMLIKYCFIVDAISLILAFAITQICLNTFILTFDIPSQYKDLLSLLTLVLLFNALNISIGVFRLFNEFKVQAKITFLTAFVKFVLFGFIYFFNSSFINFVISTVTAQFFFLIYTYICLIRVLKKHGYSTRDIIKSKIDTTVIHKLKILPFIVYNNFDVAIRMVSRQLDIVVLGLFATKETLGIFKIVKEIANIIAKLTDPIYQAIYPKLAFLISSNDIPKARLVSLKISQYSGLAGAVFYCLFILLGHYFVTLVFGEDFGEAYYIILIYYLAIFIAVITLPIYPLLHSFGLAKQAYYNQLFTTIIYIPILIMLTIQYEMIGAAASYVIYYLLLTLLTLKTLSKKM